MESINSALTVPVGMSQGEPQTQGKALPVWDHAGTKPLKGLLNHGLGCLPQPCKDPPPSPPQQVFLPRAVMPTVGLLRLQPDGPGLAPVYENSRGV